MGPLISPYTVMKSPLLDHLYSMAKRKATFLQFCLYSLAKWKVMFLQFFRAQRTWLFNKYDILIMCFIKNINKAQRKYELTPRMIRQHCPIGELYSWMIEGFRYLSLSLAECHSLSKHSGRNKCSIKVNWPQILPQKQCQNKLIFHQYLKLF